MFGTRIKTVGGANCWSSSFSIITSVRGLLNWRHWFKNKTHQWLKSRFPQPCFCLKKVKQKKEDKSSWIIHLEFLSKMKKWCTVNFFFRFFDTSFEHIGISFTKVGAQRFKRVLHILSFGRKVIKISKNLKKNNRSLN